VPVWPSQTYEPTNQAVHARRAGQGAITECVVSRIAPVASFYRTWPPVIKLSQLAGSYLRPGRYQWGAMPAGRIALPGLCGFCLQIVAGLVATAEKQDASGLA
jgi:hypothetical protein